ncbi:hypothetical protein Q5752_006186 [Cryptotrichosporon argae]
MAEPALSDEDKMLIRKRAKAMALRDAEAGAKDGRPMDEAAVRQLMKTYEAHLGKQYLHDGRQIQATTERSKQDGTSYPAKDEQDERTEHGSKLTADLANDLVGRLHAKHGTRSPEALMGAIVPRLLRSLIAQRDVVLTLRDTLGDEYGAAMTDFMAHLHQVKRYLAAQHQRGLARADDPKLRELGDATEHGEPEKANSGVVLRLAFQSGSLAALVEYAVGLGKYLTPSLLASLQDLIEEWKRDGLSVRNVVKTAMVVQREVAAARAAHPEHEAGGSSVVDSPGQRYPVPPSSTPPVVPVAPATPSGPLEIAVDAADPGQVTPSTRPRPGSGRNGAAAAQGSPDQEAPAESSQAAVTDTANLRPARTSSPTPSDSSASVYSVESEDDARSHSASLVAAGSESPTAPVLPHETHAVPLPSKIRDFLAHADPEADEPDSPASESSRVFAYDTPRAGTFRSVATLSTDEDSPARSHPDLADVGSDGASMSSTEISDDDAASLYAQADSGPVYETPEPREAEAKTPPSADQVERAKTLVQGPEETETDRVMKVLEALAVFDVDDSEAE